MPSRSLKLDLASGYLLAGVRVGGWVLISAAIYRQLGPVGLATLVLARTLSGVFQYLSIGLAPTTLRRLSEVAVRPMQVIPVAPPDPHADGLPILPYQTPETGRMIQPLPPEQLVRVHAYSVAAILLFLVLCLAITVKLLLDQFLAVYLYNPYGFDALLVTYVLGQTLRMISEPDSAFLQHRQLLWLDNMLLITADITWVFWSLEGYPNITSITHIGLTYAICSFGILVVRGLITCDGIGILSSRHRVSWPMIGQILGPSLLLSLAAATDFLYAPADYLIIGRWLGTDAVAAYVPVVQIDTGLLLLTGAIGSALLPRVTAALAVGDVAALRRYYRRGTLASAALLIPAALAVWFCRGPLLTAWLHTPMTDTFLILPWALVGTVLGGISGVGRILLIGMGRTRAYTLSALAAGLLNVGVSILLVKLGWGLLGVIVGTVLAVSLRAGLWMPWYVARQLRQLKPIPVNKVPVEVIQAGLV